MKKIILAIIVLLLVGIQLVPVQRTNPEVVSDFAGPAEVQAILERSCYDCHSNETAWPWYSYVAPVSWLVAHDVNEGRAHLNFSDWGPALDNPYIRNKIHDMVASGEMPLDVYLLMHPEAEVSDEELAALEAWAEE